MNPDDVPPKPSSPPPTALPQDPGARPKPLNGPVLWRAVFVVVLLAVIGAVVWFALWVNAGGNAGPSTGADPGVLETTATEPATPLPLPREIEPADYSLGDCFKDFNPEALRSTVVPCDTGHSAQLVALFRYPDGEPYPGSEALKTKALEACQAAKLGPAANEYTLTFERSFPSSTSWEAGDRRVDCYVTSPGGNNINASVLPQGS